MSKLSKAINATYYRDKAVPSDLHLNCIDIDMTIEPVNTYEMRRYRVYDVRANFAVKKVVDFNGGNDYKIHNDTLKDIKTCIVEEVFGEFRQNIVEMRMALYQKDDSKMKDLLLKLEQQMFQE